MFFTMWKEAGFMMIIYLAGLQGIPDSLYEVSDVDGASAWQKFWYITIPSLKNTSVFVVMTTTILSFRVFTQIWVLINTGRT